MKEADQTIDHNSGSISSLNNDSMQLINNPIRESYNTRSRSVVNASGTNLKNIYDLNERILKYGGYVSFIFLFIYFLLGISYYHHLMGWNYLNSLFFSVTTFTTIGYGNIVPDTDGGRLFTSFYIIFGVAIGGSFIGVISSFVADQREAAQNARDLRISQGLENLEKNLTMTEKFSVQNFPILNTLKGIFSNDEDELNVSSFKSENREGGKKLNENELRSVYLITYEEDLKEIKNTLRNDFFAICLILSIGTFSMCGIEDWDFIKSFYWCCVTITTVGYGDVVPVTRAGKIFTIFYAIFGCGAMAKSISSLVRYPLLIRERNSEIVLLNQFGGKEGLTEERIKSIFAADLFSRYPTLKRKDDELSKSEFILLVLHLMNKVEEKDVLLVKQLFETLDVYDHGVLTKDVQESVMFEAQERDFRRQSIRLSESRSDISRSFSESLGRKISWASEKISGKSFSEAPLLYGKKERKIDVETGSVDNIIDNLNNSNNSNLRSSLL